MNIVPQKVELLKSQGSDLDVVNAARVSFNKASYALDERDIKLIKYLAVHNHWTCFGHCFLTFRIKAPIFVARQLVKHQVGLVWNEVSRRYVSDEPEFYFPEYFRKAAANVKQGSSDERHIGYIFHEYGNDDRPYQHGVDEGVESVFRTQCEMALECYEAAVYGGVAPEQARMVLPLNTMTEWIWSGSLMAFSRVYKLRADPHSQKETQEIAGMINEQIPKDLMYSWKALTE